MALAPSLWPPLFAFQPLPVVLALGLMEEDVDGALAQAPGFTQLHSAAAADGAATVIYAILAAVALARTPALGGNWASLHAACLIIPLLCLAWQQLAPHSWRRWRVPAVVATRVAALPLAAAVSFRTPVPFQSAATPGLAGLLYLLAYGSGSIILALVGAGPCPTNLWVHLWDQPAGTVWSAGTSQRQRCRLQAAGTPQLSQPCAAPSLRPRDLPLLAAPPPAGRHWPLAASSDVSGAASRQRSGHGSHQPSPLHTRLHAPSPGGGPRGPAVPLAGAPDCAA